LKVSIITICYNSEKTIADTIQSVLSQTYNDVEYIIVDGASTDSTLEIVKSFGKQITQLISEPDKGIYDAMNKGVSMASGELIGILNSDDFYTNSDVLEQVVKQLMKSNTDALYGNLLYVDQSNTNKVKRRWVSGRYKREKFKWGWMPPHPAFFVKKSVYDNYGNYTLELKSSADYEFMLRVLYKHRISCSYLPQIITKMRVGGQSNASLSNRLKANTEDRNAWRLNGLKPFFFTLHLKPIRKIFQYINK